MNLGNFEIDDNIVNYGLPIIGVAALFILAKKLLAPKIVNVKPYHALIVEKYSRYYKTYGPGYHILLNPKFTRVVATVHTAITQHDFTVEGRTPENAYIKLPMELHYHITAPDLYYYQLTDHKRQIESIAKDVIIEKITSTGLVEAHLSRRTFLDTLKQELQDRFEKYGIGMNEVIAEIPDPGPEVKASFGRMIQTLSDAKSMTLSIREIMSAGFNHGQAAGILALLQANNAFTKAAQGGGTIFTGGAFGPGDLAGLFASDNQKDSETKPKRNRRGQPSGIDVLNSIIDPGRPNAWPPKSVGKTDRVESPKR